MWSGGLFARYRVTQDKVGSSLYPGEVGLSEGAQIRVLLVDADAVFRRGLSERLRLEGAGVFEAADEAEARGLVMSRGIDVALLGARGGTQRGLPLLRFIKEARPLIEVILMTPSDDHSLYVSIEAMKLGAFDDLLIPFDIRTLFDRVRAAARRKREKEEAVSEPARSEREERPLPAGAGHTVDPMKSPLKSGPPERRSDGIPRKPRKKT
jgi:DNA-binding NtrC family response regulator